MNHSTPIPLQMIGLSMAPWLRPGDLLLVEAVVDLEKLSRGDVVVLWNRESGDSVVHRIVGRSEGVFPFRTKGDRNREKDPLDGSWEFLGLVTRRFRSGEWKELRGGRWFWFLSVFGLYPGQLFPSWMGRTFFLKVFRVRSE